jgi:hypothetical protein
LQRNKKRRQGNADNGVPYCRPSGLADIFLYTWFRIDDLIFPVRLANDFGFITLKLDYDCVCLLVQLGDKPTIGVFDVAHFYLSLLSEFIFFERRSLCLVQPSILILLIPVPILESCHVKEKIDK